MHARICFGKILALLWAALLIVQVLGSKTYILISVLLIFTTMIAIFDRSPDGAAAVCLDYFRRYTTRSFLVAYCALFFSAIIGALLFDYEALNGTLWDLSMYVQATYSFAMTGKPVFYFHGGKISNYFLNHHSSVSLVLLAGLYKVFQNPWVVLVWQGFFLMSPALVAMLWMKAIAKRAQLKIEPFVYFLAFLAYAMNPVPLSQEYWPFAFHVAGVFFLSLAYLFYFERKFELWFLSLVLLVLERQDYGAIATTFGLLVFIEQLASGKSKNAKALFLSGCIIFFGLGYFFVYTKRLGIGVAFEARFGETANSAIELLLLIFMNPLKLINALLRPLSLKYIFFFAAASLIWLYRSWSVAKFFIPVFPYMILNSLANAGTMQMIKDHYAVIIGVGLSATLVFGVFQYLLTRSQSMDSRLVAKLAFAALFPTLIAGGQSSFRTFKEAFELWRSRAESREAVAAIRKDKNSIVCCEERLCTLLIDRPYVFEARKCIEKPELFRSSSSSKVVYLVYANSTIAPPQTVWAKQTDLLKLSEPMAASVSAQTH